MTVEELTPTVEVWPEHMPVVIAFARLRSQWHTVVFPNGEVVKTGINYAVVPTVFEMMQIPRDNWPRAFEDLSTMEQAALTFMREERKYG